MTTSQSIETGDYRYRSHVLFGLALLFGAMERLVRIHGNWQVWTWRFFAILFLLVVIYKAYRALRVCLTAWPLRPYAFGQWTRMFLIDGNSFGYIVHYCHQSCEEMVQYYEAQLAESERRRRFVEKEDGRNEAVRRQCYERLEQAGFPRIEKTEKVYAVIDRLLDRGLRREAMNMVRKAESLSRDRSESAPAPTVAPVPAFAPRPVERDDGCVHAMALLRRYERLPSAKRSPESDRLRDELQRGLDRKAKPRELRKAGHPLEQVLLAAGG